MCVWGGGEVPPGGIRGVGGAPHRLGLLELRG